MPNAAYADAASGEFKVSTSDEYAKVVNEINAADSGSYTIELENDIVLNGDYGFSKNTTTILGNGHTLSGGNNRTILVKGDAVLNLGKSGYAQSFTIDNTGRNVNAVTVCDSAKLGMYNGVTIQNTAPLGCEGGVQLNDKATLDMFGGTIKNCKDAMGVTGGGVGVGSGDTDKSNDACTFNFHGGSIENCSGGYGAGVRVGKNGTFVMSSGSISGCEASGWGGGIYAEQAKKVEISGGSINGNTAKHGGGVAVAYMKYSPTSFFPCKFIVSGGKIVNNTASSYGGGIMAYNSSTAQAISNCAITGNEAKYGGGIMEQGNSSFDLTGGGVSLCNNTASAAGADVVANKSEDSIKLPSAADMNATYGNTGKAIDGWYKDNPRYTPSVDAEPVDVSSALQGQKILVASYALQPEPATITITASKKLTGATLEEGQFLYKLKDSQGTVVATARNKADGSIGFSGLSFDTEGTYEYTISEVDEGKEGIAYDTNPRTVTVTVTKSEDATAYIAKVSEAPVFESTYTPVKPDPGTDPVDPGNGDSGNGSGDGENGGNGASSSNSDSAANADDDASEESDGNDESDESKSALPETGDSTAAMAVACLGVLAVALAAAIFSFRRSRR